MLNQLLSSATVDIPLLWIINLKKKKNQKPVELALPSSFILHVKEPFWGYFVG